MDDEQSNDEPEKKKLEEKQTAFGSYIPTSEDQSPPQKPKETEEGDEESD